MSWTLSNKIERSTSRIWKKSFLNQVIQECKQAGYDVVTTSETIVIGLEDSGQVFLRAIKGSQGWLTRYDQKLFDESFGE